MQTTSGFSSTDAFLDIRGTIVFVTAHFLETTGWKAKEIIGQTMCFVTVNRDISDRMVMEKRQRQAQEFEAIGTLAGGIAHDFI